MKIVSTNLYKSTTVPGGRTVWRLVIKICNETDRQISGRVTQNPWRRNPAGDKVEFDRDEKGNLVPGSDTKYAKQRGKNITLAPKGQPGDCVEVEWTYDVEPATAYTDFYRRKDDGTLEDTAAVTQTPALTPVEVSSLLPRETRYLACALPLPFPMSLDGANPGPAWIVMDRVQGLPRGFALAQSFPPLGRPLRLGFADRASRAVIVLRQTRPLPEGARHTVRVRQRLVRPARAARWPARWITVDLVRDTTPPAVALAGVRRDGAALVVEADVHDACAGLQTPELVVVDGPTGTCCVALPEILEARSDYSIGLNRARVRFRIAADLAPAATGRLRAADAAGNVAELDVTAALRRARD